jgi:hypothetical protein
LTGGGPARLLLHVLGLAVVLLVGAVFVGPGAFSADEGAAISQARLLAAGDGWILDHPFAEVDPSGDAYPMELSVTGDKGAAPFAKHPVYASALWAGEAADGWYADVAWSLLGTLLAAWFAARIVARFDPRLQAVTLWFVGIGTPLLFYGYALIAHTLSAAAAGAMALGAIVYLDEDRRLGLLLVAGGALAGVLVRTEAALFVGALVVACVVADRTRRRWVTAAVAVTAAVGAYATTALLRRSIIGSGSTDRPPTGIRSGSFVSDRIEALRVTWFRTGYGDVEFTDALLAIGVILLAVSIVCVRRQRPDLARVLAVGGAATATIGLLGGGTRLVPGLLFACPVLAAGFLALDRLPWSRPTPRILGLTSAVFALAVVATQYGSGGSGEWGGRYFSMLLPLVAPLIVAGLAQLLADTTPVTRRTIVGSLAVASVASAVLAVLTLRDFHDNQQTFADGLERVTAVDPGDGGLPVVVATGGYVPRMSWDFFDERRFLLVDAAEDGYPEQLAAVAARLDEAGVEHWTLVTRPDDEEGPAAVETTALVGEEVPGFPGLGWVARPVG